MGEFVPEILIPALDELEGAYRKFSKSDESMREFHRYLNEYAGRPTPVYHAKTLSDKYGFNLYLKREDLLIPARIRSITLLVRGCSPGHGKAAHHCRDRSGPARRGHGDGPRSWAVVRIYMGEA